MTFLPTEYKIILVRQHLLSSSLAASRSQTVSPGQGLSSGFSGSVHMAYEIALKTVPILEY